MIQLQKLDRAIREVSFFLDSIPSRISAIDEKIKDSHELVETARSDLDQNQKKRRSMEGDVQILKEKLTKYKSQLNTVRTNKEYSSLLKEIDETQIRIETIEESIINEMLNADTLEERIKTAAQKASRAEEKLAAEKEKIFQSQKSKEEEKKDLLKQRKTLIPSIPPELIKVYDKIAKKKEGIAMSPVTGEFCSMCFMRIRPQMLNEIKAKKDIILCENCGRILYFEEKDEEE